MAPAPLSAHHHQLVLLARLPSVVPPLPLLVSPLSSFKRLFWRSSVFLFLGLFFLMCVEYLTLLIPLPFRAIDVEDEKTECTLLRRVR
jgi:hypothetical protein